MGTFKILYNSKICYSRLRYNRSLLQGLGVGVGSRWIFACKESGVGGFLGVMSRESVKNAQLPTPKFDFRFSRFFRVRKLTVMKESGVGGFFRVKESGVGKARESES